MFVLSGFRAMGESAVIADLDGAATLIVTPRWEAAGKIVYNAACSPHERSDMPDPGWRCAHTGYMGNTNRRKIRVAH